MGRLALYLGLGVLVYWVTRRVLKPSIKKPWRIPDEGGVVLTESNTPGASPKTSLPFQSHRNSHSKTKGQACRNCGKTVAVQDHFDETVRDSQYYVVTVVCRACSARSRVYFAR